MGHSERERSKRYVKDATLDLKSSSNLTKRSTYGTRVGGETRVWIFWGDNSYLVKIVLSVSELGDLKNIASTMITANIHLSAGKCMCRSMSASSNETSSN